MLVCVAAVPLSAHPVTAREAAFVRSVTGAAPGPFVYLGAKHMFTGLDHLLFLVGVIFFLYRPRDVISYVSLFAVGHSLTLLAGVIGRLHANSELVDAVIGFSVVYKGFENIGGFEALVGLRPDSRLAVFGFGLCHGFGLASRLQELGLRPRGLYANLLSFNVGVEVGQVLALSAVLMILALWRSRKSFAHHAFLTNSLLMAAGFVLLGLHVVGYFVNR